MPMIDYTHWPPPVIGTVVPRPADDQMWTPPPVRLHPDDIEAIARRVAELLRAP